MKNHRKNDAYVLMFLSDLNEINRIEKKNETSYLFTIHQIQYNNTVYK